MNKPHHNSTKRVRYTEKQLRDMKDQTDYQKLDHMQDGDIDYSDIPETDELFWAKAKVSDPGPKKAISLRVDEDVLKWFKHQGGRYQRLMNQVLRQYMNVHRH